MGNRSAYREPEAWGRGQGLNRWQAGGKDIPDGRDRVGKGLKPSDEECSGGPSTDGLALAIFSPCEAGPAIRAAEMKPALLPLRAQMNQMFLSKTDCFNLRCSTLNGSPGDITK